MLSASFSGVCRTVQDHKSIYQSQVRPGATQPVNFCSMEETFKISTTTPPTRLPEEVADLSDDSLKQLVTSRAASFYSDTPKALQVETVMSLVQGRHTFVRAGTSFGKTRISEMYFNMFQKKIVVLVLVPLESLGNDQVVRGLHDIAGQNQRETGKQADS
ncbi:hypothetical protein PCANC_05344 [Puccinia coronata f. sp. avenae]|uniref:DEAD/DEAH box helicase domain-containing protein n=1 Tax=Puccinia coronata f. sp. avenae TaxID=200324 RepID=A0A2N5S1X1_9BASI|nr:hypothetical protein PCASD_25672 [Puccinia coronata f. sp. avenae]PLW54606.1 hypothetical protein PCANC_05344 [Puccinia coronata f. sp. avenae]